MDINWPLIIKSVRTPLGFFTLIALILDGILLATAALTEKVSLWAPLVLLGFLIACVFAIIWKKPLALYPPDEWPVKIMTVNLHFPIEPIKIDLIVDQCTFEVRNKEGQKKRTGTPNLKFGNGGWYFQLAEDVEPYDSVHLRLIERNNRQWRVNPFPPYENTVGVIQS